jgi:hypothetical protein
MHTTAETQRINIPFYEKSYDGMRELQKNQTNGFCSLTPVGLKSATLRVTTVRSWTKAIAAICLSTAWCG